MPEATVCKKKELLNFILIWLWIIGNLLVIIVIVGNTIKIIVSRIGEFHFSTFKHILLFLEQLYVDSKIKKQLQRFLICLSTALTHTLHEFFAYDFLLEYSLSKLYKFLKYIWYMWPLNLCLKWCIMTSVCMFWGNFRQYILKIE